MVDRKAIIGVRFLYQLNRFHPRGGIVSISFFERNWVNSKKMRLDTRHKIQETKKSTRAPAITCALVTGALVYLNEDRK